MGNDLARDRGLRFFVPQDGDLDFTPFDGSFDQHLVVEAERISKGRFEVRLRVDFVGPHRRTQGSRLDETGEAELRDGRRQRAFELVRAQAVPGHDRKSRCGEQTLGDVFVHLECRAQDSRAHVGNSGEFEGALQAAVFSTGAVNDGEEHVEGVISCRGPELSASRGHRQLDLAGVQRQIRGDVPRREVPDPVAVHGEELDVVARGI